MGSQRVKHNLVTEEQQLIRYFTVLLLCPVLEIWYVSDMSSTFHFRQATFQLLLLKTWGGLETVVLEWESECLGEGSRWWQVSCLFFAFTVPQLIQPNWAWLFLAAYQLSNFEFWPIRLQQSQRRWNLIEVKWSESCSVVSESLQLHGVYSPWNSQSQNTGVSGLSRIWLTWIKSLTLVWPQSVIWPLCCVYFLPVK